MKPSKELIDGFNKQLDDARAMLKKLNESQAQLEDQKQTLLLEIAKIESRRDLLNWMVRTTVEDARLAKMSNTLN
jgi:hypothetical protein